MIMILDLVNKVLIGMEIIIAVGIFRLVKSMKFKITNIFKMYIIKRI